METLGHVNIKREQELLEHDGLSGLQQNYCNFQLSLKALL